MSESSIETAVRDEYNKLASVYDRRWHNYISHSLSFLDNWVDIPSEASVLDLACGTGEFAKLLLTKNPQQHITGIDISKQMLAKAENKLRAYPNVKLQNAAVKNLPFGDASFEIVICANAFHYFEFPQQTLTEIKRVLKPNGKLIILDWCRDYVLMKILDAWLKIFNSAHQKCYTQAELNRLLLSTDFNVIKDEKTRFGIIWELMALTAIVPK